MAESSQDRWLKMLSLTEEKALYKQGFRYVAGIDEVGRGPLAGPVVAAAVVMPPRIRRNEWVEQIKDSKLLTLLQRERLYKNIMKSAVCFGIGMTDSQSIDAQGLTLATRLAI